MERSRQGIFFLLHTLLHELNLPCILFTIFFFKYKVDWVVDFPCGSQQNILGGKLVGRRALKLTPEFAPVLCLLWASTSSSGQWG